MIKILIVDDHPLIREGLKKIIVEKPEMNVVGELSNGLEVLNYLKDHEVDIALLDITLPGKDGLDVLKDVKATYPDLPVLILSIHSEERFAIRALKAGAAGYITKETAPKKLVHAIKKVLEGSKYVSETLAVKLASELDQTLAKPLFENLSDREYQVMYMIVSGKRVKDIALELKLSSRTIYTYRTRVLQKLNLKNDTELLHYAIQNRLVD
jgi:DNA-binding NarL/FixJ family response regulator